jgi:hypothetical protein
VGAAILVTSNLPFDTNSNTFRHDFELSYFGGKKSERLNESGCLAARQTTAAFIGSRPLGTIFGDPVLVWQADTRHDEPEIHIIPRKNM